LLLNFLRNVVCESLAGREQNRRRILTVFRLGQQIRRDEVWPRCLIGDDYDFSRSGNRIDAYNSKHKLLRSRDVLIPRTGNLIDARHSLRAES
jgi:hypothetical protein